MQDNLSTRKAKGLQGTDDPSLQLDEAPQHSIQNYGSHSQKHYRQSFGHGSDLFNLTGHNGVARLIFTRDNTPNSIGF